MAVPAGDRNRRSGRHDARACDQASVYRVSQAECHASSATQVAHGGDPCPQGVSCRANAPQQQLLIVLDQHVTQCIRRSAEDQMHMTVNQSGQDGRVAQVNDLRIRRKLRSGRYTGYGSGIYEDRQVAAHATGGGAVDQSTGTNDGCSILHRT